MSKQKNDTNFVLRTVYLEILIIILLVGFAVFNVIPVVHEFIRMTTDDDAICWDMAESDFVMIGVEGNRGLMRDESSLLALLRSIVLDRADAVLNIPADAIRHLDVAFYDEWDLQGTMLFFQVIPSDWYVRVNDGQRADCGMYRVDEDVVLYLMDGMR